MESSRSWSDNHKEIEKNGEINYTFNSIFFLGDIIHHAIIQLKNKACELLLNTKWTVRRHDWLPPIKTRGVQLVAFLGAALIMIFEC